MLNKVRLLRRRAQTLPNIAAATHTRALALLLLPGAPPRGQQVGRDALQALQEAREAAGAAGRAAHDAVRVDVAGEVVVVFHAQAVGVDEEFVRVALGAVVQPGALGEAREGVGDGDVEVLGGAGAGATGGSSAGGGGGAGKRGAHLFVCLPVGLLAVAVAVAHGLALGAAFEVVW